MRIAETLGAEKALELLYCTEDLEEAGGLMTLVSVLLFHSSMYCLLVSSCSSHTCTAALYRTVDRIIALYSLIFTFSLMHLFFRIFVVFRNTAVAFLI